MRDQIKTVFDEVWREQYDSAPPVLEDDTVLLETGLDSLGFAILVARLDEDLGFDPFASADDAFYPRTFKEFVEFYSRNVSAA